MPATTAAGLLALIGVFDLIGTVASGWLTDRFNPAILLVFYYGLRGVSLVFVNSLLGPSIEPPLWVFIVFYGLDWVATVPPTAALCLALLAGRGFTVLAAQGSDPAGEPAGPGSRRLTVRLGFTQRLPGQACSMSTGRCSGPRRIGLGR